MKEPGVDYVGINIGSCGEYRTQGELEEACNAYEDCVGYSMYTGGNTGATSDQIGFYPWCLKSFKGVVTVRKDHNYFTKSSCAGKRTFFS